MGEEDILLFLERVAGVLSVTMELLANIPDDGCPQYETMIQSAYDELDALWRDAKRLLFEKMLEK